MMSKQTIAVIGVCLLAGLIVGYGIRGGKSQEKMSAGKLMQAAIGQVEKMEKELVGLREIVKDAGADAESIKKAIKENETLKQALQKAQEGSKALEGMVAQLKEQQSQTETEGTQKVEQMKTLSDDFNARITELENENASLKTQIEKARANAQTMEGVLTELKNELAAAQAEVKAREELKVMSEDLRAEIEDLQTENEELKSVIKKIGGIVTGEEQNKVVE